MVVGAVVMEGGGGAVVVAGAVPVPASNTNELFDFPREVEASLSLEYRDKGR